jgi:putative colanic acid biosynthesis UDP-glucose lipid carrier transferase
MLREYSNIIVGLMRLMDLVITLVAWLLCFYLRFYTGWFEIKGPVPPLSYLTDILIINLLLVLLVFQWAGLYLPRRAHPLGSEIMDLLKAAAVVWVLEVVAANFLWSSPFSRRLQGVVLVVWPSMLILYRLLVRLFLRQARLHGRNLRSVAMIGAGRVAQKLFHSFRHQQWTGYRVEYFIDDARAGDTLLGRPVRGPIRSSKKILLRHEVDAVFIALPRHQIDQLETTMNELADLLVDVNVAPDLLGHLLLNHRIHQIGSMPVINLTHTPQAGLSGICKRAVDVIGSILLLILLGPLLLIIAAAIKLSGPGPILHRQKRASVGGQSFTILKFRSMKPDDEAESDPQWGTDQDNPRLTRLGRFLRKTSLDELPQLFNVLRGDMSLVGPRPEREEFIERFRQQFPRYMLRHHVKSGITGWAQVHGYRGRTSIRKRLQYDLDYINNWSLLLDLRILAMTLVRGFVNPGS